MDAKPIKIEILTKEEAQKYPRLWATIKAEFPYAVDEAIIKMISIATGICPHCWEHERPCTCMKDE